MCYICYFILLSIRTRAYKGDKVNVNLCMLTQTCGEDYSGHLQSPGLSPYLWPDVCCNNLQAKKKSFVRHDTDCPYLDQVSLNNTKLKLKLKHRLPETI